MIRTAMVAKSARLVAPVALAAVAVATYLIVHAGLNPQHPATATSSLPSTGHAGALSDHHRSTPKFYTVKSGDTLSQISIKTHVTILTISALNPGLNPNALQTGQRLRLRR
jgi:LysM repeat protein